MNIVYCFCFTETLDRMYIYIKSCTRGHLRGGESLLLRPSLVTSGIVESIPQKLNDHF